MSVKEPTIARETEAKPASVFDTLSAGFRTINRHPRILAIPVLLDLFFWLGPRLSLAPLVQQTFGDGSSTGVAGALIEGYAGSEAGLIEAGESFNLLSMLALHYPGLPSLMASGETAGAVIGVGSAPVAVLLFLLLPVLGVGLSSLYYVLIAQRVVSGDEGTARIIVRTWRSWGRLLRFLLLLIGVSVALGMPLVFLALLVGASSGLTSLVVTALWVAAIWAQFYLFFVVDAVVISDVGPIQAAKNSVAVVRAYLGPTLGLVILIWIITMGMPVVWNGLAGSVPGTLVGIFGNAYIAVGLAAASMTYYRNRFAALAARG